MFYKPKHAKKTPNLIVRCTRRAVKWGANVLEKYKRVSVATIDKFDEVADRFGGESTSEE